MSEPRLLFVFSSDFGEVVNANLFVERQAFQVHYAYPERLIAYHGNPAIEAFAYSGSDDLLQEFERIKPDVVFLCSGYLFTVNRIFDPGTVGEIVEYIRQSGAALVTSDPWLKIWQTYPELSFSLMLSRERQSAHDQLANKLRALQDYLDRLFADVPHLYAVPFETELVKSYSFYNPSACVSRPDVSADDSRRHMWLFVLSEEDLKVQLGEHGQSFVEALLARFREILRSQVNEVVLVAPTALEQYIGGFLRDQQRLRFVPFCSFNEFESLVCGASMVFYWNLLSSSLLYRLYYQGSAVFFARGHQVRLNSRFYQHVMRYVYQGVQPAFADLFEPISSDVHQVIKQFSLADRYRPMLERYAQGAAPRFIVEQLMQAHGGST
jgi:hypothetical protein